MTMRHWHYSEGGGVTVEVVLSIHMDVADDGGSRRFVWWAEAAEVPGFSAAADHLPDLLVQSREALSDILDEAVTIKSILTPHPETSSGGGEATVDEAPPRDRGVESRWTTSALVPA